jgi:hypothetical protein
VVEVKSELAAEVALVPLPAAEEEEGPGDPPEDDDADEAGAQPTLTMRRPVTRVVPWRMGSLVPRAPRHVTLPDVGGSPSLAPGWPVQAGCPGRAAMPPQETT